MKKIYQTPEVNKIEMNIEAFITASDPALDGTIVNGENGTQTGGDVVIPFDGTSQNTDDPASKRNGRFWDDEY